MSGFDVSLMTGGTRFMHAFAMFLTYLLIASWRQETDQLIMKLAPTFRSRRLSCQTHCASHCQDNGKLHHAFLNRVACSFPRSLYRQRACAGGSNNARDHHFNENSSNRKSRTAVRTETGRLSVPCPSARTP